MNKNDHTKNIQNNNQSNRLVRENERNILQIFFNFFSAKKIVCNSLTLISSL